MNNPLNISYHLGTMRRNKLDHIMNLPLEYRYHARLTRLRRGSDHGNDAEGQPNIVEASYAGLPAAIDDTDRS